MGYDLHGIALVSQIFVLNGHGQGAPGIFLSQHWSYSLVFKVGAGDPKSGPHTFPAEPSHHIQYFPSISNFEVQVVDLEPLNPQKEEVIKVSDSLEQIWTWTVEIIYCKE